MGGHGVEHVAHVHARHRARRALDPAIPGGAKAMTGRCRRSFTREATSPITPWCQPACAGRARRQLARRGHELVHLRERLALHAASMSRRSLLSWASCAASARASRVGGEQALHAEVMSRAAPRR